MDDSKHGEAGVIAWCNSIRFTMAKDPGRQFLHEQIQREGFDFLDIYLEKFLEGPKREQVIELLKTPGRKKNAPARTRAATAATARAEAVASLSLEDGATNHKPITHLHMTLLEAKHETAHDGRKPASVRQHSSDHLRLQASGSFKNQRIVTIADSPAANVSERLESEPERKPLPALLDAPSPVVQPIDHAEADTKGSPKELSMIVEDDEFAERSRASLRIDLQHDPIDMELEAAQSNETVFHDVDVKLSHDVDMEDNVVEHVQDTKPYEVDHGDMTSMSTATFHTIPLSPRESDTESPSARTADFDTAPLPKISLPPVPVEEEPQTTTAPLPTTLIDHEEYTMPLRHEPPAPVPGLSRKSSMPQFAGLPAPSPLRKSLRAPSEAAVGVVGTTAPPHAVKRSSTSWLSKARETKALENTAKRTSTLGAPTFSATKRKSSDMLEPAKDHAALRAFEEEERNIKIPKLSSPPAVFSSDHKDKSKITSEDSPRDASLQQQPTTSTDVFGVVAAPAPSVPEQDIDGDVLTTLLRNQGSRTAKSMGKSLGGNAAAALAEARAQAEARVAERHKLEMGITAASEDDDMDLEQTHLSGEQFTGPAPSQAQIKETKVSERRLSVSDLVPTSQTNGKGKQPHLAADTSTSTTPPETPPRTRTISFTGLPGPVFSKPPPPALAAAVPAPATSSRTAPAPATVRDFKLPATNPFSIPAAMALGMGPKFAPLTAQSSKASVFSDIIFDRPDGSPAWMPSTQDTSYSATQSQSQGSRLKGDDLHDDLDDSWGVDEKFGGHQMWTPFGFTSSNPDQLKDDMMTWSTIPSQSTSHKAGNTGVQSTESLFSSLPRSENLAEEEPEAERGFAERLAEAAQQPEDLDDAANEEADMAMEIDEDETHAEEREKSDMEDAVLAGKATIKLVQKADASSQPRSDSQQSMASSSSSQSNLGFFGQASKLVSSVLGKKTKPEVKSLQLAAAAAKKQQEELGKKAQRLKEMEARRQQALQRKADEEKARVAEEERKAREEAERRKREREEHTDKRPLRSTTSTAKKTEDDTIRRKLGAPSSQKPPSKDKKDATAPRQLKPSTGGGTTTTSKPTLKPALKQSAAGPSGSANPVTPGAAKAQKTVKHAPSTNNMKTAAPSAASKSKEPDVPETQYPQPIRKAPAPPTQEPRVASESIELPDINSEYSDSEDEDRPKRDLPDWAKSPGIAAALQQQSTINPDDIFGPIGPLRMEEIFRTRHSRFRARTSSANWTGTDELTAAEEREYARRMGFR